MHVVGLGGDTEYTLKKRKNGRDKARAGDNTVVFKQQQQLNMTESCSSIDFDYHAAAATADTEQVLTMPGSYEETSEHKQQQLQQQLQQQQQQQLQKQQQQQQFMTSEAYCPPTWQNQPSTEDTKVIRFNRQELMLSSNDNKNNENSTGDSNQTAMFTFKKFVPSSAEAKIKWAPSDSEA